MANAPGVIQYRVSRPVVRRSGAVVIVQRPVPFSIANPRQPQPVVMRRQPIVITPRRAPVIPVPESRPQVVQQPIARFQTVTPRLQIRQPKLNRPTVINTTRHVRPSALSHVARERDQMFQSYRSTIMNLKGAGHGRILIIIGNGPSYMEAQLEKLKGHAKIDLMSVNKPDKRVWPTKFWCFVDQTQVDRHKDLWNNYQGIAINAGSVRDRKSGQVLVRNIAGMGFSKDLMAGFYIGRSSVYCAMQVAHWMDYVKVYIFGCDMCAVGGKLYPWGSNPDVDDKHRASRFEKEADSYLYAARHLNDAERSRYVFCSMYNPWPFMNSFARLDQKIAADAILETASKL